MKLIHFKFLNIFFWKRKSKPITSANMNTNLTNYNMSTLHVFHQKRKKKKAKEKEKKEHRMLA